MSNLKVLGSGSKGNCYIIDTENEALILDAGVNAKEIKKALKFNITKVVGCLVTHIHIDHSQFMAQILDCGIPIYTNQAVRKKFKHRLHVYDIPENRKTQMGGFTVVPFMVPHTSRDADGSMINCMNYGYLIMHKEIGKLIYATDFEYIKYNFQSIGINHFLIETNYQDELMEGYKKANYRHVIQGHAELNTTVRFLSNNISNDTRTITCCHLSETNINDDDVITRIAKTGITPEIAKKGKVINLDLYPF